MSWRMNLIGFIIVSAILLGFSSAHAQWVENGTPVCIQSASQEWVRAVPDGEGGAIIAWRDQRISTFDIYLQRINARGVPQWTANGIRVSTLSPSLGLFEMIPDGEGGAIVTWHDNRGGNWDVYAQRVDSDGTVLWTTNGVAISVFTASQYYPVLTTDGAGGAIIAWYDSRSVSDWDIYAQRVNSAGAVQWTANGVQICVDSYDQQDPAIVKDEYGGAYIVFTDYRSANWDIYGQHIGGNGFLHWSSQAQIICSATNTQQNPAIAADGFGGLLVAWEDYRSGTSYDIYGQRLSSGGTEQWNPNGTAVCTESGHQRDPVVIDDGLLGAIVAWADNRTDYDIYTQRIDVFGAPQWTYQGYAICTANSWQEDPRIVPDGEGGVIVTWKDYRYENAHDVYAQRVRGDGVALWTLDGFPVSFYIGSQLDPCIASDGAGGAIIAFADTRNQNYDVYAQRVERNGYWGYPAPVITGVRDIPGDEGGYVNLSWDASRLDIYPENAIQEYTIWRAIDETAAMAMLERGALLIKEGFDIIQANNGHLTFGDENETIPTGAQPIIRQSTLAAETYYWIQVSTIPASDFTDHYAEVAATLFDSTATSSEFHYFQVIAHESSPTNFWISAIDSGYSVDNLAPCPPLCLAGEQSYTPEGLTLSWAPNYEIDLDFYVIYRGTDPGFTPGAGNLLASACDTILFDGEWRWDDGFCYKIAAVDVHGNESEYALLCSDAITGEETSITPLATHLEQNYPNPFNPSTRIAFGLAEPGNVSLRIYNAAGRLVRELADEHREAGTYNEVWNGRDNEGHQAASGVYFYKLNAGAFEKTRKMVLLK